MIRLSAVSAVAQRTGPFFDASPSDVVAQKYGVRNRAVSVSSAAITEALRKAYDVRALPQEIGVR